LPIAANAGTEATEKSLAQTWEHTLVTTVPIVLDRSDDKALGHESGDRLEVNARRRYESDGVVVLPQCVELNWVEALREAVDRDINNPGPYVHSYDPEDSAGHFHGNLRTWENDATFCSFCTDSPLPAVAATLFDSRKVNLLYDQIFVKEPHTMVRTRWHNDQPYWPVRGQQVVSFWIALDHVTTESGALEFIRRSHHSGHWYQPEAFGPTSGYDAYERNPEYKPIPDIEAQREKYDIVSWNLEPGDVYAFHGLTVHSAGVNRTNKVRRRGYAVRYTGDDVVYDTRPGTNAHLCSTVHKDGDILDSDQYPVVWARSSTET
jgi:ectoine hydroxylase-related dioxygenase (phytanoyl-CoA dioxygenase family)